MEKQKQFALKFSTGPTWDHKTGQMSRKGKWRLAWAKPKLFYPLMGSWLVGAVFRTSIRHVAVTNGTVVLNQNFQDIRFWSYEACVRIYPNIVAYVPLGNTLSVDWEKYEGRPRRSLFYATFARIAMLITLGAYQCDNCVSTARAVLKDAGVYGPRSAWHPKKLVSWLMENGYGCIPGPPPSYCE